MITVQNCVILKKVPKVTYNWRSEIAKCPFTMGPAAAGHRAITVRVSTAWSQPTLLWIVLSNFQSNPNNSDRFLPSEFLNLTVVAKFKVLSLVLPADTLLTVKGLDTRDLALRHNRRPSSHHPQWCWWWWMRWRTIQMLTRTGSSTASPAWWNKWNKCRKSSNERKWTPWSPMTSLPRSNRYSFFQIYVIKCKALGPGYD